jgi:hypothetical protein
MLTAFGVLSLAGFFASANHSYFTYWRWWFNGTTLAANNWTLRQIQLSIVGCRVTYLQWYGGMLKRRFWKRNALTQYRRSLVTLNFKWKVGGEENRYI